MDRTEKSVVYALHGLGPHLSGLSPALRVIRHGTYQALTILPGSRLPWVSVVLKVRMFTVAKLFDNENGNAKHSEQELTAIKKILLASLIFMMQRIPIGFDNPEKIAYIPCVHRQSYSVAGPVTRQPTG
jgi:hypothetical protein